MLIQVKSREKNCEVIINMDHVMEIAPLADGGCEIRFVYDGDVTSKTGSRSIRVSNKYSEFQQFVLQTVTEENVSKKVKELKKMAASLGDKEPVNIKPNEFDEVPVLGK
jgi:mannose/fructose/N-acetylgalactosamine-specific phosphotransferase system component IIB